MNKLIFNINSNFITNKIVHIVLLTPLLFFSTTNSLLADSDFSLEYKDNKILTNSNSSFSLPFENLSSSNVVILRLRDIKEIEQATKLIKPGVFKTLSAVDVLRKYYNSPVKDLNLLLDQTNIASPGLPMYSFVKEKSFIEGDFSKSKPIKDTQKKKQSLLNWVTNDGKYSKFKNDPVYVNDITHSNEIKKNNVNKLYDYDNIETSIITLRINNIVAYNFEVIVWPDGKISVPIKALAELVDTTAEFNTIDNIMHIKHPITDENIIINFKENYINVENLLIKVKNPKLVFIKEGTLVTNDIFVPEELVKDLLDIKTDFQNKEYTMNITSSRPLKAIISMSEESTPTSDYVIEEPDETIIQANQENKTFKVKNINYNIGSNLNQYSYSDLNNANSSLRAGFNATGSLLGGRFNLGANAYQGRNGLTINGYRASLDYLKPKYELSIGSTNASLSDLTLPNANLWGARIGSVGTGANSKNIPRLIEGEAEDNTYVELYINNIYSDKQNVKNGRYEFDSIKYQTGPFAHIKVVQTGVDGSKKTIYNRKFSEDRDLLAPGQREFMVFSGINSSSMSNSLNLFGEKFDNSYIQPIKYISGTKFRMGLSEQLTMGVNVAKDFIIKQPSKFNSSLFKNINTARVTRTGRTSSGTILSLDLDYVPTKNLRIASEVGVSSAFSKVDPEFDPNGKDFGGFVSIDYRKDNLALRGKVFSYGSNFYTPSSLGLTDKRGIEVATNYKLGNVNLSGNLTKYDSNLDNYFSGGQFNILNYGLSASGKIDDKSDIRLGVASSSAQNSLFSDSNTTYDITMKRKINEKADIVMNYAKTIRKNKSNFSQGNEKNNNNRVNVALTYDADKLGILRLSHEMMMLNPVERILMAEIDQAYYEEPVYSKNIRFTLDRSNLPIKGVTLSPNLGYRYGGTNKGLNFGLNLGYIFRTGRQISINYAYNSSFGRFMAGALNFGGSKSHSLSFNFMDNLNFGVPKGLKQNAINNSNFDNQTAIIKGMVYADLNQNGIKDEDDYGLTGIEIMTHNQNIVTTDDKGEFITTTPAGLRVIGINKETLPVIYEPKIADALIKVRPQKVYVANFGIILTPGNLSGTVNVQKEGVYNNNIVVSLLDEKGKDVKYTTTDSNGAFYIDSIPPGKYNLVVDKNYLAHKGLQLSKKDGHQIEIPVIDDDIFIIEDIKINLIPKKGEFKQL